MTYSIQYPSTLPDPDFPQLMGQLRARLHRYCARMTGSILDGEDIVQETLIKANESYDARTVQNVEGWLFRIAHNTAMDFLRKRARASRPCSTRATKAARPLPTRTSRPTAASSPPRRCAPSCAWRPRSAAQ